MVSKRKTITYPYLPKNKKIRYAPASDKYIVAAKKACKELSSENNHPTGAVVVLNGKVIGRGGNQTPLKSERARRFHKEVFCVRRAFRVKTGEKYWLCPGCASLKMHAERQAIRDARANMGDIRGAKLYLWGHWWACESCWNDALNSGIEHVYLLENSEVLFNRDNPANIIGSHLKEA